jgi:hypothetical protein
MGYGELVALVGLVFSMISIKLMSIVENTQFVITGAMENKKRFSKYNTLIVAFAIGTKKFFLIRVGIIFFGKISAIIFAAESMYPERVVERATLVIMNTVLLSNRINRIASKHGRHTARRIRSGSNFIIGKRERRPNRHGLQP